MKKMKPLQSLISASMVIAVAFTSCNDKKEEGVQLPLQPLNKIKWMTTSKN
jgi:hypothetical protein